MQSITSIILPVVLLQAFKQRARLSCYGLLPVIFILSVILIVLQPSHAATLVDTVINNTVTANYSIDGSNETLQASVVITTDSHTPSLISFHRISESGEPTTIHPAAYNAGAEGGKLWSPIESLTLVTGEKINFNEPVKTEPSSQFVANDPIVIHVTDYDQNKDPDKRETVFVTIIIPETGDKETILLTETGLSTGIFVGAVETHIGHKVNYDGRLNVARGAKLTVTYNDQSDSTDINATAALIDPLGSINLAKIADKKEAAMGDLIGYEITLHNSNVRYNLTQVEIKDTLPLGFYYQQGSATLNGKAFATNKITIKGRKLLFSIGEVPKDLGKGWLIRYRVRVGINTPIGYAINQAQAFSANDSSNIATAKVKIKDILMRETSLITGRIMLGCQQDASNEMVENIRLYTESGRSTLSDKNGFWHMEGLSQKAHVIQLDIESLPTGYRAINCEKNNDNADSAISKFINSQTLWRANFYIEKHSLIANSKNKITIAGDHKKIDPLAKFTKQFANNSKVGFEILWPPHNYVPAVASTKIAIKYPPRQKLKIYLNNKPVSRLNYDGSVSNKAGTIAIRRWRGVDINTQQRDNILMALLLDKNGKEVERKTHTIHFSGKPTAVEYLVNDSLLLADGKTSSIITFKVKDEDGFPMRANTHGYFSLSDSQIKPENNQQLMSESGIKGKYKYYIKQGGIAQITLAPTSRSGKVSIDILLSDKTQTINAWLKPKLRDWILVGLVEGSLAYKKLSGNMRSLADKGGRENEQQGRIALFAKGKIKGNYLLTLAYDSAKKQGNSNNEKSAELEGNIDPDGWYTVYADQSSQQDETASSKKLFLKLEKNQFYALFGDNHTGLTVTELSRYERTLTGLHSEYSGDQYSYNFFASHTEKRHQRDEIAGDGTSGLYYLSESIVQNSESIRIETRDPLNFNKVVATRQLVRHKDYNIDYDSRTLFFKFPIFGRDKHLNHNFIIADYETDQGNKKTLTAGGRAAIKFNQGNAEAGVTFIHEGNNDDSTGRLLGLDMQYKPSDEFEIKAEIAQTQIKNNNGTAWLAEVKKKTPNSESSVYIRRQASDFGLGHQKISEQGQQKIGVTSRYKLDSKIQIKWELSQQRDLENDAITQRFALQTSQQFEQGRVSIGTRHSSNKTKTENTKATALLLGGSLSTKNKKASLHGKLEKNFLGDRHSSSDPDRASLGVDIALTDKVYLFAEHEISDEGDSITQSSRVGITRLLWEGAKAKTSLHREVQKQKIKTYAMAGLSQHIKLSDQLLIDLGLDYASTINSQIKQSIATDKINATQKSNRDDYIATSLGYRWKQDHWGSLGRLELRNGDQEDKVNLQLELNHQIEEGKHFKAKLKTLHTNNSNGDQLEQTTVSMGIAWQPFDAGSSVLERLDYIDESDTHGGISQQTRKLINNIHLNQTFDRLEIGLHHGIQHILSSDDKAQKENSTLDVGLIEAKYKLNKLWSIATHGGYSHDWDNNNVEKVVGVSVSTSPAKNTQISLGYNFEGFSNHQFDTRAYTSEGVFTQILYKFDQDTLKLNR